MNHYTYSATYQPAKRPSSQLQPKRFRRKRTALFVLALLLIGVGVHVGLSKQAEAQKRQQIVKAELTKQAKAQNAATLNRQLASLIAANPNIDLSISLLDNATGNLQHYGDAAAFDSASVGKLITATDFLHQTEAGDESLSETLGGNTAQYELEQMIVNSDDDAWTTLNNELSYTQLQTYATAIGLSGYNAVADTLTSNDIAGLLQKVYAGRLLNQTDTQLLLGYMKQANYRDFIVPAVPGGDTIYHKVGLVDDDVHDAAIITDGDASLELVIFTDGNGTYNWPARAQLMQQITKDVLQADFSPIANM